MQKLVPITRLGKFFGGEDYELDVGMGQEWLEGDMNFTIVLYRIDRYKTKTEPKLFSKITIDEEDDLVAKIRKEFGITADNKKTNYSD